ncbi:MAG: hypothetical protein DI586_08700 [Micavibrio aeruginosavorus]|uniref:Uncharacterized protein n=1 Tax=Micavibrio aeruginosavorus TaxID=349221 RepID=A0A2W5HM14_9BACT|nr:MAG: hypothetical protein DI586_08700 [Micavibrio aeruginosavorus]
MAHTDRERLMLAWIGRFLYGVETHFFDKSPHADAGYATTYTDIDACGYKRDIDRLGEQESKESYLYSIKKNKEFWESKQ